MSADWRDESSYRYLKDLSLGDLAWECLRRNKRYRKEYRSICSGDIAPEKWGLRFRG